MAYRIFISLIVLVCAYLVFETVRHVFLQNALLNEEPEYVLGNADGDITFVKFLDYGCQYCRDAHPVISDALRRDGNVKFLPRPIGLLGAEGINAALLPYAAAKQGKFAEMHEALISNYRIINDQVIQDLSLEIGLDHQKLKADLNDKDVIEKADQNMKLFKSYRLIGTPSYAIGENILFAPREALSANEFITLFNEARGQ